MRKPVVLITGGSGGIGREIAAQFAAAGYRVAIHYHQNEAAADRLVHSLRERGYEAVCVQSELCCMEDAQAMVQQVKQNFGSVDVLVNNAGIAMQKLFIDTTAEDWRRMFAVDVDAAFFAIQAVLPDMLHAHEGVILNVSSMWGQVGASMEVAYSAAKSALIGLTYALAKELGPNGVRVNCVAPGVIDTPMNDILPDGALAELCEEIPLMRIGLPEDVASTCRFLAGEGGRYYTGQVLAPNGGMVIGG